MTADGDSSIRTMNEAHTSENDIKVKENENDGDRTGNSNFFTSENEGNVALAELPCVNECNIISSSEQGTGNGNGIFQPNNNESELKPVWASQEKPYTLVDGLEVREFSFGRGIIASRRFLKGEMIFEDLPIVSSQHFYSRKVVTACEGCIKTLGSLRTRLGKVLQADIDGAKFLETDFPDLAVNPLLDDPHFSREGMGYEQIVPCDCSRAPQCRAVFCSEKCMEERGETHRQLSKGDWREFESYASKKHENLRVALMLLVCPRRDEAHGFHNPPWSRLENIPPEWVALRERIVEESYEMLKAGWVYDHPLCTLEEWDRVLGTCDLTSKDLKSVNRANVQLVRARRSDDFKEFYWDNAEFWTHITITGHKTQVYHANTEEHTHPEQHVETFDEEDARTAYKKSGNILPDIEGIGVYKLVSLLNHSCYPNIEVTCRGDDRVRARCIREIHAGDEVCMSYLDEDDPLIERQNSLWQDFIFHCRCIKCRVQCTAHILQKGSVITSDKEKPLEPLIDYLKKYAEDNELPLEILCEDIIRASPEPWATCKEAEEDDESESDDEPIAKDKGENGDEARENGEKEEKKVEANNSI